MNSLKIALKNVKDINLWSANLQILLVIYFKYFST